MKNRKREEFIDLLIKRYKKPSSFWQRVTFLRKKYSWLFVVGFSKAIKRIIDVTLSFFLIVFCTPFLAIISIIIYFQNGPPVFHVANRVGQDGKEFPFPKFRTMQIDTKELQQIFSDAKRLEKLEKNSRVTSFGRFLRKYSLDELPQLFSVLKGEMSLVGPRPPLPCEVKNFSLKDRQKLSIKPGLTCIWQISGRSNVPFQKQIELDLEYIKSQNLLTDLIILLKTIPAVLLGRGAY